MKTTTITQTKKLVLEECFTCGIGIAMTESQKKAFHEKGQIIHCVLGHRTVRRQSDVQRLTQQLSEQEKRTAELEAEIVGKDALLHIETKKRRSLERRVRNGVCPHCRRSFQNLKRHIANQHAESEAKKVVRKEL